MKDKSATSVHMGDDRCGLDVGDVLHQLHKAQEHLKVLIDQNDNLKTGNLDLLNRCSLLELKIKNLEGGYAESSKGLSFSNLRAHRDSLQAAARKIKSYMKYRASKSKLKRDARIIETSGMFDSDWYLESYPDVRMENFEAMDHFIKHGAFEGRDPCSYFSIEEYLRANPDLRRSQVNPLVHYLKNTTRSKYRNRAKKR